jgi:hypothetical protein
VIKELLKVNDEINKVLRRAEKEDTEFPGLVGALSGVTVYGNPLSIHIVLGIIDEFIKASSELRKQEAMTDFEEDALVQKSYDRVNTKWNNRNKVN